jgi:ribosomal protein RSM22 (predicted rRNA methylase)
MSKGKWCHFKQRLQRPPSLMSAKAHATLDWEDEPFSFVAFGRKGVAQLEQQEQQLEQQEQQLEQQLPARPLLEGQDAGEGEGWGWGRVLWPTIHVCLGWWWWWRRWR